MSDKPSKLAPSKQALRRHRKTCESGAAGYTDPDSGLFVLTSVYLREQGECCGSGCRHCPYSEQEQLEAGRPDRPCWPWPNDA
ncbi:MAG: DUF5522 domain-containing protein [Persicimonas sp.]